MIIVGPTRGPCPQGVKKAQRTFALSPVYPELRTLVGVTRVSPSCHVWTALLSHSKGVHLGKFRVHSRPT
jgi:hypothetical protein